MEDLLVMSRIARLTLGFVSPEVRPHHRLIDKIHFLSGQIIPTSLVSRALESWLIRGIIMESSQNGPKFQVSALF